VTTPYSLTPVGARGLEHDRTRVVFGKPLSDSLTRHELARRVAALTVDNEQLLLGHMDAAARAAVERARARLDYECETRVRAQRRLDRAAAAFGAIVRLFPETADIIDEAREDIWHA
jgi:hypothetical protein